MSEPQISECWPRYWNSDVVPALLTPAMIRFGSRPGRAGSAAEPGSPGAMRISLPVASRSAGWSHVLVWARPEHAGGQPSDPPRGDRPQRRGRVQGPVRQPGPVQVPPRGRDVVGDPLEEDAAVLQV